MTFFKIIWRLTICFFFAISIALGSECRPHGFIDDFTPKDPHIIYKNEKKCLFIKIQRTIRKLIDSDVTDLLPQGLKVDDLNDYHLIANFYHKSEFYIALIPKKVSYVTWQSARHDNSNPADKSHSQLRFGFDESNPILLISQKDKSRDIIKLTDFVSSYEAVPIYNGPKLGPIVSLANPLKPKSAPFGYTLRFISTETDKLANIKKKKGIIDRLIYLSSQRKSLDGNSLLKNIIDSAEDLESMEQNHYNLVRRNCTNSIFEAIDETLGTQTSQRNLIVRLTSVSPDLISFNLSQRGLESTLITNESHPYLFPSKENKGCGEKLNNLITSK